MSGPASSPFDNPVLAGFLGDQAVIADLGFRADLAAMIRFEEALAKVQADHGIIPADAARTIAAFCATFEPDIPALAASSERDGLAVPGLVAQIKAGLGADCAAHFHKGTTSQDLMDTSLMLRLARILPLLADGCEAVRAGLARLDTDWGTAPLMAVTRMRAALPTRVSDRTAVWERMVLQAEATLRTLAASGLPVQLGGPIGTGAMPDAIRADLAAELGLADPGHAWHTDRAPVLRTGEALVAVTGAMAKIGLDLGLMSQDGVRSAVIAGGGSSAMAHKVNPVDAELLVALGRYVAGLHGTLAQATIQEYERSGTGWTMEWLILPQMIAAAAGAVRSANRLLGNVERLGTPD